MKYVVIGGDAAGMSAAMQLLKFDQQAKITIIERGEIYSYAQCGIPYFISGDVSSRNDLIIRSAETYRDKFAMNALINHDVKQINVKNKIVSGTHTKTGQHFNIHYDKLLIASGADPNIPDWEGNQFSNVHTLKDIPDMDHIIDQLSDDIKKITIIGGGYIGLEMAETFKKLGKHVKIINRSEHVGSIFDKDMALHIQNEAKNHDIEIVLEENTKKITGSEKAEYVVTNKSKHKTDLVLISTGISPNTQFLINTDIRLNNKGAIIINEHMETNIKDIYAAGDCATQYHRIKKANDYVPLGTTANKQGRIAGMNMAGIKREFKGIVGSSILKFFDLTLGKTGLSEKEAKHINIPYKTTLIEDNHIASYYPNTQKLHIKIIYNKETMRLLGAQIIGKKGVDKRIDVLAVALFNKMKLQHIEDLDLSYAPPYNGVWDPIQRAVRKAQN